MPLCTFTKLSGGSAWSPETQNKKTIDGWKRTCSKKILPISWPFTIILNIPLCWSKGIRIINWEHNRFEPLTLTCLPSNSSASPYERQIRLKLELAVLMLQQTVNSREGLQGLTTWSHLLNIYLPVLELSGITVAPEGLPVVPTIREKHEPHEGFLTLSTILTSVLFLWSNQKHFNNFSCTKC